MDAVLAAEVIGESDVVFIPPSLLRPGAPGRRSDYVDGPRELVEGHKPGQLRITAEGGYRVGVKRLRLVRLGADQVVAPLVFFRIRVFLVGNSIR